MQEAIELLVSPDEDMPNNIEIFIAPPDPSTLTDEDSAGEDEGGLVDNLSGRQLMASAEIKLPNNVVINTLPGAESESAMPGPSSKVNQVDKGKQDLPGPSSNVIQAYKGKQDSPSITPSDFSAVDRRSKRTVPRDFPHNSGNRKKIRQSNIRIKHCPYK